MTKQEQAVWRMLMATYQQHGQPSKDFCDVITIRNRKMSLKTINLEYVVEQVLKVNPGYRTFECSFCRGLM